MSPYISSHTQKTVERLGEAKTQEQSHKLFRLLIENSVDIVTVLDKRGAVQYDNPSVTTTLGYSVEERLGDNAFNYIHPDDVTRVRRVFGELLEKPEETRSTTFRYRHKNGAWRYLESLGINLLGDPVVAGVLVTSRDISHFIKTQKHLERKEKELAHAQKMAHVGSWSWNIEQDSVYWSDELYRIHGLEPQERDISYKTALSFAISKDRSRVKKTIKRALKEGSAFDFVYSINKVDGERRYLWIRGRVVTDENNSPVKLVGVCWDITKQRRVEKKLHKANEQLEKRIEQRTQELEQANAALQEQKERHRFLAEVGDALSSTLDFETTLNNVTQMIIPGYADWCAVDVVNGDGELERFSVAHKDSEKVQWAKEIHMQYPPDPSSDNGVYKVLRTQKPLFFKDITNETLCDIAKDEKHLTLLRGVGMRSAVLVPLVTREGDVLGVLTLIRTGEQKYTREDVSFFERIAYKAAQEIYNARLYNQAQEEIKQRKKVEARWMRTYNRFNRANQRLEHHVQELEYAKEKIRHEQVKDEAILESIGEGLVVANAKGEVVLANHVAEQLMGEKREDMIGRHVCEVLKMEDEQKRLIPLNKRPFGKVSAGHDAAISITDGCYYRRADGTRFPVSTTASVVDVDGEEKGKVVVFRDMTKEKQIEHAKSEFVSIASHQLRTPLSTINWYAETLLMRADSMDEKQRKYIDQIHTANQRLIRLVNSLLNVSRLELGMVGIEPKPVHVVGLVREALEDLEGEIRERDIALTEKFDEELPPVELDPKITQIVVQNLVSNACKYIPDRQEKKVTVRVFAGSPPAKGKTPQTEHANGVIISVKDNGVGISRKERQKIFNKFFRCDVTKDEEQEGSGLGLYISKQLIELMGGKIWFKSRKGRGSTFYVYIPQENKKVQMPLERDPVET